MEIVRSKLLSAYPEVLFGMSTNSGGVSPGTMGLNLSFHVEDTPENVKANRTLFFSALGISEQDVAFTRQQHTVDILKVSGPGNNETCDALCTNVKNVFLAISIADCTPVILYDPVLKVAAGIHAGWRGTAGRIVPRMVERLSAEYGTNAEDLIAFIGPSAGKCCYEVGWEVASQFDPGSYSLRADGKYLLDVKHANVLQLLDSGVPNSNIEVHSDCSIHDRLYHSYRRDGKQSGRMYAVIGINH
ncbi:MAG: peptidoglycan editing factor PgeF [Bacteroidota bacterium]